MGAEYNSQYGIPGDYVLTSHRDEPSLDLPTTDGAMGSLRQSTLERASIDLELDRIVSSLMPCTDVVDLLSRHGCQNLTSELSREFCSQYPISNGGFGDIYRGKLRDERQVAIKTVRMFESSQPGKYHKSAARELYAWSKCKHPNVVELMGLAMFRDSLAMISIWVEKGTLPNYLRKHPSTNRYLLSTLISRGLAYLHSESIIHGDLKGDNILISHDGVPMLNDFGNARVQNSSLQFSRTTTGVKYTMRWAAPELLTDATAHTREADVYALGMTILEVFTGDIPYSNVKNNFAVMHHVVSKKEFPTRPTDSLPRDSFGDEIWEALTACWSYEPISRPHAADVEQIMGSVYLCKLAIPRVHVLIIGVNEYEHGPQRIGDARSMLQYFTSLGVPSSHLVCLLGRRATEEGIMNAVKSHLIDNPLIESDDPVVVYFSGRGYHATYTPVRTQASSREVGIIQPYETITGIGRCNCNFDHLSLAHILRNGRESDITATFDINPPPTPDTLYGKLKLFLNMGHHLEQSGESINHKSNTHILLVNHKPDTRVLVAQDNDKLLVNSTKKYPYSKKTRHPLDKNALTNALLLGLRKHELAATGDTVLIDRFLKANRKTGNKLDNIILSHIPTIWCNSYDHPPLPPLAQLPSESIETIADFLFELRPPRRSGYVGNGTICCVKPTWQSVKGFMQASVGMHSMGFKRWVSVLTIRDSGDWEIASTFSHSIRELTCLAGTILPSQRAILARFERLRAICIDNHDDAKIVTTGTLGWAFRDVFCSLPPQVRHLEIKHTHGPDAVIISRANQYCPNLESLWLGRCTIFNRTPPCSFWESYPLDHDSYISNEVDGYAHTLGEALSPLGNLRSIRLGSYLVPSTAVLAHRLFHTRNMPAPLVINWQISLAPPSDPAQAGQDAQPAQISDLIDVLHQAPEEETCDRCWEEFFADAQLAEINASRILKEMVPSLEVVEWMDWFSPFHLGVRSYYPTAQTE